MLTAIEPVVADAGHYTTMQTCRALGIHRNTLNRYCLGGKIKAHFRKLDNRKYYIGADIKKLWRTSLC